MKKIILLFLFLQFATTSFAQSDSSIKFNWEYYAKNKDLTFRQIVTTCDSIFALINVADTVADTADKESDEENSNQQYNEWKKFWASRLDAQSGKLHNLAAGAIGRLGSSGGSVSDCGETSALQTSINSIIPGGTGWKYLGPQNTSAQILGRPTQISVNPSDPTEVYMANTWGGLWKTNHASAANPDWHCLTDNDHSLAGLGVTHFVVDYSSTPHHIYLSFGYPQYMFYFDNPEYTVALYCSTDDGSTYKNIDLSHEVATFATADNINDIKLWPGNNPGTAGQNYLFVATQFKIIPVNIDNVASIPPPTTAIVDFANPSYNPGASLPNLTSRFRGIAEMNFIPSDPQKVYFSTISGVGQYYPTSARLYQTDITTHATTDLTSNLANNTEEVVSDGNCASKPGWTWDDNLTTTSGSTIIHHGWQYSTTNFDMEYTPESGYNSECLNISIGESYIAATNYTISFTLTVPANTKVDVYLSDWVDHNAAGDYCGTPIAAVGASPYTTGGPYMVSVPVSAANAGMLVFKASYTSGSYPPAPVILDDVSVQQLNIDYINNLKTSKDPAAANNLFLFTTNAGAISNTLQKTGNAGASWATKNLPGYYYNGNYDLLNLMEVSPTNANYIYMATQFYPYGKTFYLNYTTGAVSPVTYGGHIDIRSLCAVPTTNPVTSSTNDHLFIGGDGGISYVNNINMAATTPLPGTWVNLNGTGFNCSFPWDIGASVHGGNIAMGVGDNDVLQCSEHDLGSWTNAINGTDAGYSQFGKRFATRNILFYGISGRGGSDNLRVANVNPAITPTFHGPAFQLDVTGVGLSKLKTTYNGEYWGRNYLASYTDPLGNTSDVWFHDICNLNVVGSGAGPFTSKWNSLTSTPTDPTALVSGVLPTPNSRWPTGQYVQAIAPDMYDANFIAGFVTPSIWNQGTFVITQNATATIPTTGTNPTWEQYLNTSGPTSYVPIIDMCVDPRSMVPTKRLWASAGLYQSSPGSIRVFTGTYTGTTLTWTDYSQGLPEGPVNALVYDEQSHYLFAGTDMGVYAINVDAGPMTGGRGSNHWECYSLNLPNSFINALDINRCTGKLYASCVGRGGYQADLPPDWNWNGTSTTGGAYGALDFCDIDYISSPSPTVWNYDRDETRTIIIQSGTTLIINNGATLSMGRNKNIIVQPGARLIVDNATITNSCGTMWGCINVLGNSNVVQDDTYIFPAPYGTGGPYPTTNQGLVVLTNHAVIEHAFCGVFVGGQYYDGLEAPDYVSGHDGGLVLADNMTFHNCVTGAELRDYGYRQFSSFINCHFTADDTLPNAHYIDYSSGSPRPMGSSRGILCINNNQINIQNCVFETIPITVNSYFNPDPDLRGVGYVGYNTYVNIESCTFTNLTRGIFFANYLVAAPEVNRSTFNNCWRSISACNSFGSVMEWNIINTGPAVAYLPTSYPTSTSLGAAYGEFGKLPIGIYSSQANEYFIKYNTINNGTTPGSQNYGIMLNATNSDGSQAPNLLYENKIYGIFSGISPFQDNRGVSIRCNTMNTTQYGIDVEPSAGNAGRINDQGAAGCVTATGPANNQFYQNPPGICYGPNSIFSNYGDPANDFRYYQPANDPYVAHCISGPTIFGVQISTPITCPLATGDTTLGLPGCPFGGYPRIGHGGVTVLTANVALLGLDIGIAALHDKIDGGSTARLLDIIRNQGNNSATVEQKLMDAGPYLSDHVLIAAITRTPALTYADLKNIVLNNSALNNPVFNKLVETDQALSNDSAVASAQEGGSKMKKLKNEISELTMKRNDYIHALQVYYAKNEMWEELAILFESHKYYEQAFPNYLRIKKWHKATEMIAHIDDIDMKVLLGIQLLHAENNMRIDSLTCLDSVVIAKIGSNPETHAGEVARIWYCAAYNRSFYELMPVLDTTHAGSSYAPVDNGTAMSPVSNLNSNTGITIYPNPAQNEVTLTTENGPWPEGTVIKAVDMNGKKMMSLMPKKGTNSVTINTTTWANGVYIFIVNYPNGKYTTAKVVINKS